MRNNLNVQKLVMTSFLLAFVVVLQLFASVVKIGQFEFTLVLIPISIGAILFGPKTGALLGFIFSIIVLFQPGTQFFLDYGIIQTVIIVLSKGTLAGFTCGIVYNLLKNKSKFIGSIVASILTPIINTGIFALGTIFLLTDAMNAMNAGDNAVIYLLTVVIGVNFIVEFIITIVLSPTINKICEIGIQKFNLEEKGME